MEVSTSIIFSIIFGIMAISLLIKMAGSMITPDDATDFVIDNMLIRPNIHFQSLNREVPILISSASINNVIHIDFNSRKKSEYL